MKKLGRIVLLLLALCCISACDKGGKIVEEKNEGVVEGYKFKVTDEVTDYIKIQMNNGDIMLAELKNEDAPITIENFKKLVSEHFYDGLIFHRVIKNFMIQTGDPTGTGFHGSDETIKGEFRRNGVTNKLEHTRGVLSMARGNDMDSASSQFFIVHKDSPHLNGSYASFGRVIAGLEVIDKIATVETDENDKPVEEQVIKSIRFVNVEEA